MKMSKVDQRYVFNDHVDPNEDDEIERLLQRSKRLGTNFDGLRRRPLHPNAEDYEDSDDEAEEEIKLIKKSCKDELFERTEPVSSTISVLYVFIIIACVLGLAIFAIHTIYKDQIPCEPPLIDKYYKNIAPYKQQFPSQSNELWANVFSGIHLTSSSDRLSVFLIIHDATTNTSCLAKALGHVSANLLDNSSQPLIVPASDLDPDSFRQDLSTRRVIVVEEIQKMSSGQDQKQLLLGLADSENPILPASAVVFTLQVHDDETKSALRVAELELDRVWNWIDSDSRAPLIVRVTSGFVYRMANEKEVISC